MEPSLPLASLVLPPGPEVSALLGSCAVPNATAARSVSVAGWVSEPSARGTWSLVYSCVFTIGLCIWTAVHPNIAGAVEKSKKGLLRKLGWAIIAIFSPEVVLAAALLQFNRARKLRTALRRWCCLAGESKRPSTAETQSNTMAGIKATSVCPDDWSLEYCFYAVMGGLTVDVSRLPNSHDRTVVTLTDNAIRELADRGHFLPIEQEVIRDRSKADVLGKGLAICQVAWLVVQSIARAQQRLPLTLLEIHAMVHVFGATVMYMCWWKKPKDIGSTILVDPIGIEHDLADMLAHYVEADTFKLKPRHTQRYFLPYVPALFADYSCETPFDIVLWVSPALLGAVNAAVHMVVLPQWGAHTAYFPTLIEAQMWTVANSILLGVSIIVFLVTSAISVLKFGGGYRGELSDPLDSILAVFVLAPLVLVDRNYLYPRFQETYKNSTSSRRRAVAMGLFVIFICGTARIVVIVESFASLRMLPLGVFEIPNWTLYLPHL